MCWSLPANQNIGEFQVKVDCSKDILCWVVLPTPKCSLDLGWHFSIDMCTIYCPNTFLHGMQKCILNWHELMQQQPKFYMTIYLPSNMDTTLAVANLKGCLIGWRSNHILPKFTNCIQHLFEMAMDSIYRPSPVLPNHSKTLVMPPQYVETLQLALLHNN